MQPTYTTKHGQRYRYYCCPAGRSRQGKRCPQGPVAACDLEASILQNLGAVLGSKLNWAAIRESVDRIQCEGRSHRVAIGWKDGTRLEYQMAVPNRRGVNGGEETGRVPRVSRLMALAIKFEGLIREGAVRNQRDLAEAGQVSRARMSQIMSL